MAVKPATARNIAKATSLMAVLLLLSKGMGLFREIAVANAFGAGLVKDANTVAYIIPSFFLIMLGGLNGPFHLATMGAVTRLQTQGKEDEVPGLLLTIVGGTALLTGVVALLVGLGAPWVVGITGPHLSLAAHLMAVEQLRIMSPLVMIGGIIGVLCGISNVRDRFANASLTPMVSSLAVIAIVVVTSSPLAIAWGTLVGAVGQLVLQGIPVLKDWREIAQGRKARPVSLTHGGFLDMLRMLIPASLSSSIGSINAAIGTAFCSSLGSGTISIFNYSNLLMQFPLGILLTALLVPMFPRLTEAAASGDRASLHGWMNRGVQSIALATLPMTGMLIVLGEPAVRLVFQHGHFTAADTRSTGMVLSIVALSSFMYATRDLFTRVFYAQNKSRIPLLVTACSIVTNLAFNSYFVRYGIRGLALSTTLVTTVNLLLLGTLLHRDLEGLGLKQSVPTVLKALLGAVVASGVVYEARELLARLIPPALPVAAGHAAHGHISRLHPMALLQLVGLGLLGLGVYVGLLVLLRVPMVQVLRRARPVAVAVGK